MNRTGAYTSPVDINGGLTVVSAHDRTRREIRAHILDICRAEQILMGV